MTIRPAPPGYRSVVGRSHRVKVTADAWLAGELIAENVPILAGSLTDAADQRIPEALTLTVPARGRDGRVWVPASHLDPLSQHGQRLRLSHGVTRADGSILTVQLGWFGIDDWTSNGWQVEVAASGLARVLDDAGLLAPTSPPAGATFASEAARLVESLLPIAVDVALADRAAPGALAWQDDRLAALYELADAWPAQLRVDEQGVLFVTVPYDDDTDGPDVTLVERAGTVISSASSGSRQGVASVVVARGEDAGDGDRPPVVGYSIDTDPDSPTFAERYGSVVAYFASPLLTTAAQCIAAARTRRATLSRAGRVIPVETVPDARIRQGTRVDFQRVERVAGVDTPGELLRTRVLSSTLPMTAAAGPMTLSLGVLP